MRVVYNSNFSQGSDPEPTMSFREMSADEVRTIWYALTEYSDTIRKQIGRDDYNSTEDLTFLGKILGEINQIRFAIKDDHVPYGSERDPKVDERIMIAEKIEIERHLWIMDHGAVCRVRFAFV